jgi:hypothetical protein
MNKPTIILLLILTLFSCKQGIERIDITNELRGNTFNMTFVAEKETLTIEFKDSTCSVFENNDRNLPWRIATFDNAEFLVIESGLIELRTIAIKQRDENTFDGLLIGRKDYEMILEKRNPKWNKDLLIGNWVAKELNDYYKNDSIPKSSSFFTQQPPPANFEHKRDFQEQSLYEITLDSIYVKYGYSESKSKIDINSSFEFLTMNVKSNFNITEQVWEIKKLTDSVMIIDKTIMEKDDNFSFTTKTIENIELIKKR